MNEYYYNTFHNQIQQLESSRHSIDNNERADLSELCGHYKTEIESLRVNILSSFQLDTT